MLIGNVGKEPVVHYYDADQAVAQVSFATTEKGYTLANGMQVPDHTDWHNLVFFRGLAKVVEKYVHKGHGAHITSIVKIDSSFSVISKFLVTALAGSGHQQSHGSNAYCIQ